MVTQATSQTEEATPTGEDVTPEAEVTEVEDGPLIPQETEEAEEQGPAEEPEEGAAKAETEEAAEDQEDTEEQATLTRQQHEEELSRVRSGLDRRISELERTRQEEITAAEKRAAEAEQQLQARTLDIQAAQLQQQRADHWRNQGHSDEVAAIFAAMEVKATKTAYEYEQRAARAERERDEALGKERSLSSRQAAVEMAREHGVHEDDIPLLTKTGSVDEMTALAKRLGVLNKQVQEQAAAREAAVPAGGEANQVDSGGGAGGRTDDQKLADPNAPLDEVEEILKRRGQHPFL